MSNRESEPAAERKRQDLALHVLQTLVEHHDIVAREIGDEFRRFEEVSARNPMFARSDTASFQRGKLEGRREQLSDFGSVLDLLQTEVLDSVEGASLRPTPEIVPGSEADH